MIGKWLKVSDHKAVFDKLVWCEENQISNPNAWITKTLSEKQPDMPDWFRSDLHEWRDGKVWLRETGERAQGP